MKIAALNFSANAIGPGERWKSHAPDVMNTFRLAELLGVKHIVSQSELPAGSPTDTTLNWVMHTYPPEMQDVLKYQWEVTIDFWSKAAEKDEQRLAQNIIAFTQSEKIFQSLD